MGVISPQVPGTRVLNVNTTAVGNVGAGEDDLMSYALPADTLNTDGKIIRVVMWGRRAANGNSKTVNIYLGATNVYAGSGNTGTTNWYGELTAVRTGASAQTVRVGLFRDDAGGYALAYNSSSGPFKIVSTTETDTATITVKATATGVADNDIIQDGLIVELLN